MAKRSSSALSMSGLLGRIGGGDPGGEYRRQEHAREVADEIGEAGRGVDGLGEVDSAVQAQEQRRREARAPGDRRWPRGQPGEGGADDDVGRADVLDEM